MKLKEETKERLEDIKLQEQDPLREEYLQLGYYNPFNQYNIFTLANHMKNHKSILE